MSPGWNLFKRKREWREMVQTILGYFPHLVCEPYFDCLALGWDAMFKQDVSQDLAGHSCLLLTRACSGFGTVCKSESGWSFLLVADKIMLWGLKSL